MTPTISIYKSYCIFPFTIGARHTRVVFTTDDGYHRYEVMHDTSSPELGHIHHTTDHHDQGLKLFYSRGPARPSHLIYTQTLDPDQVTHIMSIMSDYPHKRGYNIFAANSNTFTQRVLDQLNIDYALPRNAFGKGYQRQTK